MIEHDPKTLAALDALEAKVPQLQAENPDEDDFFTAFAGEADVIEDNATKADYGYVRGRIDCMLKNAGAIPARMKASRASNPSLIARTFASAPSRRSLEHSRRPPA